MEKNEIINLIHQETQADKFQGQYGITKIPYHLHNGADSPHIQFTGLGDTPNVYTGKVGYSVIVNSKATGLIFGAKIGNSGSLFDHYTSVGNTGTSETDLYSDTIIGNTLLNNGDKIQAEYGGSFVSSGTATREVRAYFGGNSIFDTGALTLSLSAAWTLYISIVRVSATVIRYMVSFTTEGAALSAYTGVGQAPGLTLSSNNILKITGQAAGAGAATNDIVAKLGNVILISAA